MRLTGPEAAITAAALNFLLEADLHGNELYFFRTPQEREAAKEALAKIRHGKFVRELLEESDV